MQAWQSAGLHCSANERRADEASRDVEAWLKCKYMREHLGEEYSGMVSAVTSFGIFITLDAMYVEGLVHITELGGEYYRFDEVRQELRGERTGIRYALGSRVRVQVSRVDLDGRRIDFRLLQDGEAALPRTFKDQEFADDDTESGALGPAPGSARGRRRSIDEPLVRAPKTKAAGSKHTPRPVAGKGKDKARRRS
jgi:ribonuclease R